MKKIQQSISILAAVIILFTMLPANVFAQNGNITSVRVSKKTEVLEHLGGQTQIFIGGESLDIAKIKVKVTQNNLRQSDIEQSLTPISGFSHTPQRAAFELTFPENNTDSDITYELSFNATGSEEVFQDEIPASVTVKKRDNSSAPANPFIERIIPMPIGDESYLDNYVLVGFSISGKNLDAQKVKAKILYDHAEQKEIAKTLTSKKMGEIIYSTIQFPLNNSDTPKTYKVYFNADGNDSFEERNSLPVVIKKKTSGINPPPIHKDELIKDVDKAEHTLPFNGGEISFVLFTDKSVLAEQIKIQALLDGKATDTPIETKISGDGSKKNVSVTIAENTTPKEQVYTLKFNASDAPSKFQEKPVVTIKVDAQKNTAPQINEMIVVTPNLPKNGGTTAITVKGSYLKEDAIFIRVSKIVNGQKVEQKSITENAVFYGTDKIRSTRLTFPAAQNQSESYSVEVGTQKDLFSHEGKVTVGENTSGKLTSLQPAETYINKEGNQITLRFYEPIFAVRDLVDVKSGISLDLDGDGVFEQLKQDDLVMIQENLLIITLSEKTQASPKAKIKLKERIIKDSKNKEGDSLEIMINKAIPMIFKAQFLQGETLDFNGGKVIVKLTGENLITKSGNKEIPPIVQVLRLKALRSQQEMDINITNEKSTDSEQVFSFILPKNDTKRMESYMVRVSLDGGRTFSSAVGHNIYDRTKRLIASVFPKDADTTAPTISFISIQSYGTLGGGTEEPNKTHTDVPVLQESKKTFVYIYGANLKKNLTKVKIVDQNGIEWTPVHDSASDSADQFIMIGFDGTGLDGNGNNQMAEIICPNNIAGDQIFKYLFAADGKNFEEEIFVTAKVLDDGLAGKRSLEKNQIKEVTISYVSENEEVIAPSQTTKGYLWNKAVSYNVQPILIDGYKIKGYYSIKKSADGKILSQSELTDVSVLNDRLKDFDEIRFVYQATKNKANDASSEQGSSSNRASVRPDPVGKKSETITPNPTPLAESKHSYVLKIQGSAAQVTHWINGKENTNKHFTVLTHKGELLLPVRSLFSMLGFEVKWNSKDKTVLLKESLHDIKLSPHSSTLEVNGIKLPTNFPPVIKNGQAYVNIEHLNQILSATKEWQFQRNDESKEILITKK